MEETWLTIKLPKCDHFHGSTYTENNYARSILYTQNELPSLR